MPMVCIQRPNRSRPRFYNQNSVVRIFGYALRSGENDKLMVRAIIETYIPQCRLVCDDEIDAESVGEALEQLGRAIESAIALKRLMKKLRRFPLFKPIIRRVEILIALINAAGKTLLKK